VTAAFVSTLLLLGIVGWSAGWVAAGSELENKGQIDPTTTTQASKPAATSPTPARPTPSPSPTANSSPAATPTRADQFEMPNLVNKDFRAARVTAREKKLGVDVVFNEPSRKADGFVEKTVPEAGYYVFPGLTIHLHVAGPAPAVFVPDIMDKPCEDAKNMVLDAGLKITAYPSGERGKVKNSEPASGAAAHWNDGVKLYCS
jgi:hypothetical protein